MDLSVIRMMTLLLEKTVLVAFQVRKRRMKVQVEIDLVASLLMVAYQRRQIRKQMQARVHLVVSVLVEKVMMEALAGTAIVKITMPGLMVVDLPVIIQVEIVIVLTWMKELMEEYPLVIILLQELIVPIKMKVEIAVILMLIEDHLMVLNKR
jgi:hypothetical protein